MPKPKLIVASARLPVTMTRKADGWEVNPSTGGLVTALKSVAERRAFHWLGWPGAHVADADRAGVREELKRHGSAPVFITKNEITGFYEGFANRVLWPLFHNLWGRSHFDRTAWRAYERVNRRFADELIALAKPGDEVWIHDYQLALVPRMLRRAGLKCPIGFFLHIPFPSAETYRSLPVREEILRGMLGADLLGFHTYEYVSHFRNACLRVLGVESDPDRLHLPSHSARLAVLPIGIDPVEISQMAASRAAGQEFASLMSTYPGKRIIVGVDRLDYTKGIPQKLLAFEEFLRAYPKWRQKVVLIQIAAPSRTAVEEYQALKREVDELVGRINGKYGSPSSMPVVYVNQSVPRARLVGLYQAADVALITPVRDGMNLVALEYVAARGDRGGTLILSEFAGAAHCLPGAKLVSPYNGQQMTLAIAEALSQESPDMEAFAHMRDFVKQNTSMVWANRFLDLLEASTEDARSKPSRLDFATAPLKERVRRAKRPLLLLDYDGTLRPFVLDPSDATPGQRIRDVLAALSARATVYVISGRPADTLDEWLGDLPIGLVCEHGLSIKPAGAEWERNERVSVAALRRLVQPILEEATMRTPGSRIEYKSAAVAWHYRGADPEYGSFQANEMLARLTDALKRRPYNVLKGNRVIEVRHESASKGRATASLLKRHKDCDFLFCAGDDRTDEEMMDAVPKSWEERSVTCWVGSANSHASRWVESAEQMIGQLEQLAGVWTKRRKSR